MIDAVIIVPIFLWLLSDSVDAIIFAGEGVIVIVLFFGGGFGVIVEGIVLFFGVLVFIGG